MSVIPIPSDASQQGAVDAECLDAVTSWVRLTMLPAHLLPQAIGQLETLKTELLLRHMEEILRKAIAPISAPDQLLRAEDAAAIMNVPKSYVYEMVRARRLPHVRVGKKYVRIPVLALRDWLAQQAAAQDIDSGPQAGHTRGPNRRQTPRGTKANP